MSALADASGVSKPVVYRHFENCEAVVIALIDDWFKGAVEFMASRLDKASTIFEYFDIAVDSGFEYEEKISPLIRNITNGFSSTIAVNNVMREKLNVALKTNYELLTQQGVPGPVANVAAYTILEMISNVSWEYSAKRNKKIARETLKSMIKGALHSLLPESGPKPITPLRILKLNSVTTRRSGS